MSSQATIYWARGADGLPLHISEAARGLKCSATCYQCDQRLIARQGDFNRHTFAHESLTDCSGESAVHALAKHLLATLDRPLRLPPIAIQASATDIFDEEHNATATLFGSPVHLRDVRQEKDAAPDLRPDCTATLAETSETLAIEIHFRNPKSQDDIKKIRAHDLSSLEIDMSSVLPSASLEEIADAVFDNQPRHWLHYSKQQEQKHPLHQQLAENIKTIDDGAMAFLELARQTFAREAALPHPKSFSWATFQASAGATRIERIFRLSRAGQEWEPLKNGYFVTSGVVEGFNMPCPIALTICRASDHARLAKRPFQHSGPCLEIVAMQYSSNATPLRLLLTWHGIDDWKGALQGEAQKQENERIQTEERARAEAILRRLEAINSDELWSSLPIPPITATYGTKMERVLPQAKLSGEPWRKTSRGWVTTATANIEENTNEPIIVVARPWGWPARPTTKPTSSSGKKYLLIEFDVPRGLSSTSPYKLRWNGIDSWLATLFQRTKQQYQQQQAAAVDILDSVGNLFLLDEAAKTGRAFELLGLLEEPINVDKTMPAWRCARQCWRALAIKYCLLDLKSGALFSIQDIARSPALQNLLSLETDLESSQLREQSTAVWLERLTQLGCIQPAHIPNANGTVSDHYMIRGLPKNLSMLL